VQGKGSGGRHLEGKQVGFKGRFEREQGWQLTEGEGCFVPGYCVSCGRQEGLIHDDEDNDNDDDQDEDKEEDNDADDENDDE
jgi:hypothetical protein